MSSAASQRTVLVVCGGAEAVPGIERVRRLGLRVAVSDGNPDAPGFALADERLVASTYDGPATLAAARALHARTPLAGVLSIAADVPVTVAHVARGLGLPGLAERTAALGADKLAMKDAFRAAGVPIPWYAPVETTGELRAHLGEHPRLILKPVDSRGARGVLQVDHTVDLDWALATARAQSPSGRVLVEAFVDGPQLSTESLVQDGRVFTLGFSDRNYEHLATYAPYVIENGGCQPSVHLDEALAPCDAVLTAAAQAIGLATGVLKGDLVLSERGPVVIEVAPRLSGGWFCTDQIPWSTGVDLVQAAARLAMGERVAPAELAARHWRAIAVRYAFPVPGRVAAIHGAEEVRAEPWLRRLALFVGPGEELHAPTDHTQRAGLVLATGATRSQAVERAESAVGRLRFELARGDEAA